MDESDYREASGRTLHALAALSAEIGGVRAEARADMERISCRVQAKVSGASAKLSKTVARAWRKMFEFSRFPSEGSNRGRASQSVSSLLA